MILTLKTLCTDFFLIISTLILTVYEYQITFADCYISVQQHTQKSGALVLIARCNLHSLKYFQTL